MRTLLKKIRDKGILLEWKDGKLLLSSQKPQVDPSLLQEIREKKEEIIAFLKNNYVKTEEAEQIPLVPLQVSYPLSSAQSRLWTLCQLESAVPAYHIFGLFDLDGQLNLSTLEKAFDHVLDRHEILRTVFTESSGGDIRQKVLDREALNFSIFVDLQWDNKKQMSKRTREMQRQLIAPFDLQNGPLLRTSLYKTDPQKYTFVFVIHHIISDGWSMQVLARDLFATYAALERDRAVGLPPLRIQYKDYASWEQQILLSAELQKCRAYWKKKLEGELPLLALSGDCERPAVKTFHGGMLTTRWSEELCENIKQFSRSRGGTLFMGLLSILKAVLYRYTNQEDLIIGTVVAGRDRLELEDQIGFYVNTIALRTQLSAEKGLVNLFDRVRKTCLDGFAHQAYPFDRLLEDLSLARDVSRSPVFDVMLVLQNASSTSTSQEIADPDGSLRVQLQEPDESIAHSKYDLVFTFEEQPGGLHLKVEYNKDIFSRAYASQLARHLEQMAAVLLQQSDASLAQIDYLLPDEKKELLGLLDHTKVAYPREETIVSLFEQQVVAHPDRPALCFQQTQWDYTQLNQAVNQLAHYLRKECHVQANDLIAVKLDRSDKMIVALLAILKAGGAYLPIDPSYPEERIHYMLSDSRSSVLVDDALLNKFEQVKDKYTVDNPSAVNQASDLAYVIYTSGSTGNPKGVQIEHRNVVRLLKNEEDLFDFAATDVWTVFHSYCFDFSVWEMYGALLFGGKLVVVPKETAQNPALFYQLLVQQKVTILNQTPSYFSNLIGQAMKQPDADLALRYVIFGGEALQPTSLRPWRVKYPQVRLINMYGITETTVHVTYKEITEKEIALGISDIGQPIPTLSCLVLDDHRQLVPRGVPGEMYIGGAGLARAYLNRPALTKERFITHPFAPGQRLYRSSDVARIQMSGDLQYMGRNDHQVKVRGYRIETAEIERHLYKIKAIKSCIVLAHANESGDAELIAYYSLSEPLSSRDIRSQLKTSLPAYMLPTHLMEMEELALTKNGKIDRKALPLPGEREVAAEGPLELPQGVVEETLLKLWQEVLRNERIAVLDDFFSIGGDSIKILRLNSGIQESLGLTIPLIELYKHTSIRQQAQFIEEQSDQLQQFRQRQQERESEVNDIFLSIKRTALEQLPQEEAEKIEDVFPMTAIEQGMVFESLIHQGEAIYHDQFVYPQNFTDFRFETFGKALQHMVEKHAILRTTFEPYRFGEAVQIVWKKTTASFGQHDLSALSNADQEHAIGAFMQTQREQPFDLQNGPLWRMDVFAISDSQYIFVWQFHHAILDGWSNASFITELNNLYFRLLEQVDHQPPKLAATYRDFALQQYQDSRDESLIDFWKKELASYTRLDLFRTDVCQENVLLQLDVQSIQSLEALSARVKISERSICLAAFLYLFRILCNENEVLIGLVTNGRPDKKDGDKILGCFLNSLPLKMPIDDQWTCREFIEAVDRKLVSLKKGERLSTFDIARALGETADHSQNPFFDLLFNFVDFHTYENVVYEEQGTEASDKNAVFVDPHEATNTHMDCSISRTGGGFSLSIRLARQLRSEHTAKEIGERFLQILRSFLQQADLPLSEVEYLSEEERQTLLQTFNDTTREYPRDKTIVDLFFEQAAKYPDHQALFCDGRTLSYTELNELSNQLAHHLREVHGFQKGDLCAIYLPLSDWLIASILGILKAGGIFLPIDTLYPQERVDYMLEDSQAALLIDEEFWHSFYQQKDQFSTANPEQHTTARDLAYVIYTSGSTGNPKGVMVEHQPVVNLIFWHHKYYGTTCEDRATRLLSPSFDASLWETFPYLMCGACLYIVPQDIRLDIPRLNDFFIRHQITIGFLPTPLFEQWEFDDRHSLRCILTGGDSLTIIPESSPTVYNNYGPTENGIVTSSCEVRRGDQYIPIGKPIPNNRIYILDSMQRLSPIGVPGEIYLGGEGLARGYFNRPELTAEKFIEHPVLGERLYRSGDIGRWLPSGDIEFLGRVDAQVKIRGNRIEIGEIERALCDVEGIAEAVVLVSGSKASEKYLRAFVLADRDFRSAETNDILRQHLPVYMLPSSYHVLDEIPMTSNGKIDRKVLAAIPDTREKSSKELVAARNDVERELLTIWEAVLQKEVLSIRDDFFELGGHSLKAMQLKSKIWESFQVDVPLTDFFQHTSPEAQARLLTSSGSTPTERILPASPQDSYPLSSGQYRIWILCQFEGASAAYNMPLQLQLSGDIDRQVLAAAFDLLIQRHESLRTVFRENEAEEVRQYILDKESGQFELQFVDVEREVNPEKRIGELVEKDVRMAFDLANGPLLRACLFRCSAERSVLYFNMHHIIGDAWSLSVLSKELQDLYGQLMAGQSLHQETLPFQYKDYASWQQSRLESGALEASKAFWCEQFAEEVPVLNFPTTRKRPLVKTHEGAGLSACIGRDNTKALQEFCRERGASLFMGLLTSVQALLHRYTRQTEITIGTVVAMRDMPELADQIGFYVNTLALKNTVEGTDSFESLFERMHTSSLEAFGHQQYPFDELVQELKLPRDTSRDPLVDFLFSVENQSELSLSSQGPFPGVISLGKGLAKQEIDLNVVEMGDHLRLELTYNTDLYTESQMTQFLQHFQRLLPAMLENPTAAIGQFNYLTEQEQKRMLVDYNATAVPFSDDKTVVDLFREQVLRRPNATAVSDARSTLTYQQLDNQSDELAKKLQERFACTSDDLLAVKLPKGIDLVLALWAVLKSGAAYIPIAMDLPEERIQFILAESNCKALIDEQLLTELKEEDVPSTNSLPTAKPRDLAYVIYTSGSTGRPKGIEIEHRSLVCRLQAELDILPFEENEIVTAFTTSFAFDVSILELFLPLLSGGRLVIPSREELLQPELLERLFAREKVNLLQATPGLLEYIHIGLSNATLAFESLRQICVGGERLDQSLVQKMRSLLPHVAINNHYGPTETTIDALVKQNVGVDFTTSIGRPLPNTEVYLLNEFGSPAPHFVEAEICIGGPGLLRGYLQNPSLTAEKLVDHPFAEGQKLYRTGDIGKWNERGEVDFVGRMDQQVKLRGFRIELGDIQSQLQELEEVKAAFVHLQTDEAGTEKLVAYVVSDLEETNALRGQLRQQLPHYMIPDYILSIPSLPLTRNGKIDVDQLPTWKAAVRPEQTAKQAPQNPTEESLLKIWQELLELPAIGRDDNFFDIGGNSILLIKLHKQVKRQFNIEYSLSEHFNHFTISAFSDFLYASQLVAGQEKEEAIEVLKF